ncbi:MAG: hypothetical protein JW982_14305 [Spirochaetes bacterium]|nr:hypothetical protein [Spirochaetota bacterium]
MSGFGDVSVIFAIILTVLSALLCIVYGIIKWNDGDITSDELEMEKRWEAEEEHINRELDGKGESK